MGLATPSRINIICYRNAKKSRTNSIRGGDNQVSMTELDQSSMMELGTPHQRLPSDDWFALQHQNHYLLIGDYNNQLDGKHTGFEAAIGPHGSSNQTNNICSALRIMCALEISTINISCDTKWCGDHLVNEIHYIGKCWWSSLLDVRSRHRADVESDNHLLIAKCLLQLSHYAPKIHCLRPFNIATLWIHPLLDNSNLNFGSDLNYCQEDNEMTIKEG